MGELAPDRILIIVVVALLLFGAKRLPEVGASLGRGIREFKRSLLDMHEPSPGNEESRPAATEQLQPGTRSPSPPTPWEPKRLSD